jgi:hypothetical protein
MLKIGLALILIGHGLGHSMGLLQVFKVTTINPRWQGDSWLLTGLAGPTVTQAVGAILWTGAMIGFVALAGVVMGWLPASWWQTLAVTASLLSLAGIVLFPLAFPTFSTFAALVVDVVLLVAVLSFHWTPADLSS